MKFVFTIAVSLLALSILGFVPEAMEQPLRAAQAAGPSSEQSPSKTQAQNGTSKIDQGRIDPAKLADIQKLFEVSGAKSNMEKMMGVVAEMMKSNLEKNPRMGDRGPQFANAFSQKFLALAGSNDLLLLVAQVYGNLFSRDDIRALNQFYESPAGRHFVEATPKMMEEFLRVGQQWAAAQVPKMLDEMMQEYPELNRDGPAPGQPPADVTGTAK
jgi:hypothetical protein